MKISAIKIFTYATLILLFFITIDSFAQQKATLYGKLKDEYNKPVQGLRIFVLEQPENGIVSNENGTFELPIIAEVRQSIIFSAIGYKDTVKYLEEKLIETIIVYEKLNKEINNENIIDWLLENGNNIKIIILECNTSEGNMFINGFGGICGYTHYEIENSNYNEEN
jgi:hypothetical protein